MKTLPVPGVYSCPAGGIFPQQQNSLFRMFLQPFSKKTFSMSRHLTKKNNSRNKREINSTTLSHRHNIFITLFKDITQRPPTHQPISTQTKTRPHQSSIEPWQFSTQHYTSEDSREDINKDNTYSRDPPVPIFTPYFLLFHGSNTHFIQRAYPFPACESVKHAPFHFLIAISQASRGVGTT